MKRKLSAHALGAKTAAKATAAGVETVDDEDVCPICVALIISPVKTHCGHTMCAECMEKWAEVSITRQMEVVGLDDAPMTLLPSEIQSACPMCRTLTRAIADQSREAALREKYPCTYQERQAEAGNVADDDSESVETLTLYIGNTHSLVRSEMQSKNTHNWTFFVRPSRADLIEEVQIFLVSPCSCENLVFSR
jgi:hypothetical protein